MRSIVEIRAAVLRLGSHLGSSSNDLTVTDAIDELAEIRLRVARLKSSIDCGPTDISCPDNEPCWACLVRRQASRADKAEEALAVLAAAAVKPAEAQCPPKNS